VNGRWVDDVWVLLAAPVFVGANLVFVWIASGYGGRGCNGILGKDNS